MARINPFVGPRPLRREDRIFGRSEAIEHLIDTLFSDRILLLHAPSGAGKTSLVTAGLIPRLEETEGDALDILPIMRVNRTLRLAAPPRSQTLAQP